MYHCQPLFPPTQLIFPIAYAKIPEVGEMSFLSYVPPKAPANSEDDGNAPAPLVPS